MHQVKIFKSLEFDFEDMEHRINEWLAQSGVKVLAISGNIAPQGDGGGKAGGGAGSGLTQSDVIVFILYEKP